MNNKKTVKQYFKKYFKEQYFREDDLEFKSLVRILNKKQKEVKNSLNVETVKRADLIRLLKWWDDNSKIDTRELYNEELNKYFSQLNE